MFMSVIQFELIFVKGVSLYLDSSFCMWMLSCSKLSFLYCIASLHCQKLVDFIFVGLFLGSLSYFIDIFVYFFTNAVLSWFL